MNSAAEGDEQDSVDRVAEVTDEWRASPLTEPEGAMDPKAKRLSDHGDTDSSVLERATDAERIP
jgi:hypothetical protein